MAGVLRLTGIYLELAKARLTALVLLTAAVGYALAADGPLAWSTLFWTILGTALTAGGANGLNQCSECRRTVCMARTRNRPVVSHRISLRHAWRASVTWARSGYSCWRPWSTR